MITTRGFTGAKAQTLLLLRTRVSTRRRHHVREKRWNNSMVLLKQVQKKFDRVKTGRPQGSMDKVFWKGREGKSLIERHIPFIR